MIENIIGLPIETAVGAVGLLAALVSVVTEVLKKIVSDKFPTKLLVVIVSLVMTIVFILLFCTVSVKSVVMGAIGSFVIAFVAMYGWDTLKELVDRFKYKGGGGSGT